MNQGDGRKQTKLSQQQKDILLWLAKQEGRIRPKRPPVKQEKLAAYPHHTRGIMAVVERMNKHAEWQNEIIKRQEQANEIVERYERLSEQMRPLTTLITNLEQTLGVTIEGVADSPPDQEPDPEPPKTRVLRLGTRFTPRVYLGRAPTSTEKTSIWRALDRLEQKGLIKRTGNRGKGIKTTHVKLTAEGIKVAYELQTVDNSQALEATG